jgi:hypothetical protein
MFEVTAENVADTVHVGPACEPKNALSIAASTDGGGLSDHVFAIMYLLGIRFQPRMSSPNDRRLYAFEAKGALRRVGAVHGRAPRPEADRGQLGRRATRHHGIPQSRGRPVADPEEARHDAAPKRAVARHAGDRAHRALVHNLD